MTSEIFRTEGPILVRRPFFPMDKAFVTSKRCEDILGDEFKSAIAIASPSLLKSLQRGPSSANTIKAVQYHRRMSTRPTPFGLFAGVGLAWFGNHTTYAPEESFETYSRPDMSWFVPFIEKLEADPEIRKQLVYFPNQNALLKGDRFWLKRAVSVSSQQRHISVLATPPVRLALRSAKNGIRFSDIVGSLVRQFRCTQNTAETLCNQLCDLTFFVSELRPPLNEPKPLEYVLDKLRNLPSQDAQVRKLQGDLLTLDNRLKNWDSRHEYQELMNAMQTIGDFTEVRSAIHVDCKFEPCNSSISNGVESEVRKLARIVLTLNRPYSAIPAMFKRKFEERYQFKREVPLLELLDDEFGMGSPYKDYHDADNLENDVEREDFLSEQASLAIRDKRTVLALSDLNLKVLQRGELAQEEIPVSMDLFVSILSGSNHEIDSGDFKIIQSPIGGTLGGGRVLGRFANLLGNGAKGFLTNLIRREEALARKSNSIIANLSFWPVTAKSRNVSIVPNVFDYTIVEARSTQPGNKEIPVSEILVGIENNKFYARWKKTGQKVLVRPDSMLNPSLMPEAMRFLADISFDGFRYPSAFDWGSVEKFSFLPRLEYGKIIVSRARWRATTLFDMLSKLSADSEVAFRDAVAQWRHDWNVPSLVEIAGSNSDDNWTLLDLSHNEDLLILRALCKGKNPSDIVFFEHLSSVWSKSDNGSYASEFVITLVRNESEVAVNPIDVRKNIAATTELVDLYSQDEFLRTPGSDWVYMRIRCGDSLQDTVIRDCSRRASDSRWQGFVKEWFFVRYHDTEAHLRLRFHLRSKEAFGEAVSMLCNWSNSLVRSSLCSSFSIETYDREIERYGGKYSIGLLEQLFCIDSELTSQLLSKKSLDKEMIALLSINELLSCFGLNVEQRCSLFQQQLSQPWRRAISAEYRVRKPLILRIPLNSGIADYDGEFVDVTKLIATQRVRIEEIAQELRELESRCLLKRSVEELLHDIVHMHCNRLLGTQRTIEWRVRGLLAYSLESFQKRIAALAGC